MALPYTGFGRSELSFKHRPRDTRTEQMLMKLAVVYYGATGLMSTRGANAPYASFVAELLQYLRGGAGIDFGEAPTRRVINAFKRLYPKA
jgi:hypothetical protein